MNLKNLENWWQEKILRGRIWRQNLQASIFRPLLRLFDKLGATPNFLSNLKIILALLFLYFLKTNLPLASIFLIISLILDILDGPLARYQKIESDRGKFIDIFTDQIVYGLTLVGVSILSLSNSLNIVYQLFIVGPTYLLAIVKKEEGRPTSWLIKPRAGLTWIKVIFYITLFIYIFLNINWLNQTILFLNVLMTGLSLYFYFIILKRWQKKLF